MIKQYNLIIERNIRRKLSQKQAKKISEAGNLHISKLRKRKL